MRYFLAAFAVLVAASWGFQYFWVWPAQRCEAKLSWWDPESRVCATPVDISIFTRRAHPKRPIPRLPEAAPKASAVGAAEAPAAAAP